MPKKKTKAKKIAKKPTKRKSASPLRKSEARPPSLAGRGGKKVRYFEAVGRRKTAVARVRLFEGKKKEFLVNGKLLEKYFPITELQQIAVAALKTVDCFDRFNLSAKARGGGLHAQAEAIRHGTARALVLFNSNFRKKLKKAGFLTRDPRMRERKKFGLKRARRAPQWQKR